MSNIVIIGGPSKQNLYWELHKLLVLLQRDKLDLDKLQRYMKDKFPEDKSMYIMEDVLQRLLSLDMSTKTEIINSCSEEVKWESNFELPNFELSEVDFLSRPVMDSSRVNELKSSMKSSVSPLEKIRISRELNYALAGTSKRKGTKKRKSHR